MKWTKIFSKEPHSCSKQLNRISGLSVPRSEMRYMGPWLRDISAKIRDISANLTYRLWSKMQYIANLPYQFVLLYSGQPAMPNFLSTIEYIVFKLFLNSSNLVCFVSYLVMEHTLVLINFKWVKTFLGKKKKLVH